MTISRWGTGVFVLTLALQAAASGVFRCVDAADAAQAVRIDTACARDIPRPSVFVPPSGGAAP